MFFTTKSKNGNGEEALVNVSAISYVLPSLDGNCVIYFSAEHILVSMDSYAVIKEKILASYEKPVVEVKSQESVLLPKDNIALYSTNSPTVADELPANLPRLPSGQVDKRTSQYKEYVASLTVVDGSSR